jgi:hypothetical protein
MTADMNLSIEQRVAHLLRHLGLAQVHLAARSLRDWQGLATTYPDRIASITLVCPPVADAHALLSLASRFLLVTGDRGPVVERTQAVLAELAGATHVVLQGYSGLLWDDVVADHPEAIGTTMEAFLHRMDQQQRMQAVALPEGTGEHAGLFYRIQGAGPPLLLFPLGLARSQWEPLIRLLATDYCTITLEMGDEHEIITFSLLGPNGAGASTAAKGTGVDSEADLLVMMGDEASSGGF